MPFPSVRLNSPTLMPLAVTVSDSVDLNLGVSELICYPVFA